VAGRVLAAYVIPEDAAADLAFGWASGTVADPRTDGHAWINENGTLTVAAPSKKVILNNGQRVVRPIEYLVLVALNGTGATYLLSAMGDDTGVSGGSVDRIGVPAFPLARVVWVDDASTTTPLYPVVSAFDTLPYPNKHFLDDIRVIDVAAWASGDHPLATLVQRFTAADSNTSMGAGWSVSAGTTWGISSNKAYNVVRSGFSHARKDSGLTGDGLWKFKITTDSASVTTNFGVVIRAVDASNYVRVWNNGNANLLTLQTWVAGGFGATIANLTQAWVVNTTYDVVIATIGRWYRVWVNGTELQGAETWLEDTSNGGVGQHLTGSGFGPFLVSDGTSCRWDDFVAIPNTVTLPSALQQGAVPPTWTAGSTQIADTFTGTNGTTLAAHPTSTGAATWTEVVGAWTIQTNKASVVSGGANNISTVPQVTADYEASVIVTMPSAFTTNTIRAGLAIKVTDIGNGVWVRLYKDVGTCEIELIQTIAGSANVTKKLDLSSTAFVVSTDYTLKCQVKVTDYGQLIRVFLDDKPRLSFVCSQTFSGTGVGLYRTSDDDGCVFDSFAVKALT
jgi:hypothetical protein